MYETLDHIRTVEDDPLETRLKESGQDPGNSTNEYCSQKFQTFRTELGSNQKRRVTGQTSSQDVLSLSNFPKLID